MGQAEKGRRASEHKRHTTLTHFLPLEQETMSRNNEEIMMNESRHGIVWAWEAYRFVNFVLLAATTPPLQLYCTTIQVGMEDRLWNMDEARV